MQVMISSSITQQTWNNADMDSFVALQYISRSFNRSVYEILDVELIKDNSNGALLGQIKDDLIAEYILVKKNFRSNGHGGIEWLGSFESMCATMDSALLNNNMVFLRRIIKIFKPLEVGREGVVWCIIFKKLPEADEEVGRYVISKMINIWRFGAFLLEDAISGKYGNTLPYWSEYVSEKFIDDHHVAWYILCEKLCPDQR